MTVNECLNVLAGQGGSLVINGAAEHAGNWKRIKIITNTVFAELVDSQRSGSIDGITFPANYEIFGDITKIRLTSGSIIAYS